MYIILFFFCIHYGKSQFQTPQDGLHLNSIIDSTQQIDNLTTEDLDYAIMKRGCEDKDSSDLIDVHVVGAVYSEEFALGSHLTVECTLNASSPCASTYGLSERTRLVLIREQQRLAEGRANSPPRFNFVAQGEYRELKREDTFVCLALDESGAPIIDNFSSENYTVHNDATFNYCARPPLPETDCEVSSVRPLLKCAISPDDKTLERESYCNFSSSVSLTDRPLANSTHAKSQCGTGVRVNEGCEWDLSPLQFKPLYLQVIGSNAIGSVSRIRPLQLSRIIRLMEALQPPLIREVQRSALEGALIVDLRAPKIDDHLITMAIIEGQPEPQFIFSIRLRCKHSIFPVLHPCSIRFNEKLINVSNASSVTFEEVPLGARYELELVALVPPNTRWSPPLIVYHNLQASALHWAMLIFGLFVLLVIIIALVIFCFFCRRTLRAVTSINHHFVPTPQLSRRPFISMSTNEYYYPLQPLSLQINETNAVALASPYAHSAPLQYDKENMVYPQRVSAIGSSAPVNQAVSEAVQLPTEGEADDKVSFYQVDSNPSNCRNT